MGPIDYSTQVQSPFASALQGYQAGTMVRNDQAQQSQLQAQRAQQQAMQQDLYNLSTKEGVTGQDYAGAMTKYPQLSEQLKKSWDVLNSSQQQAKLSQGTQAYAAIRAGRPDIAEKSFRDRSEAAKVSGDEKGAKEFQSMADLIKLDPKNAATSVGLSLAAYLGPEKFASTYASLGGEQRASDKFPTDMRKDRAEATTAEATAGIKTVEAANAPTRVGLENANVQSTIQDREAGQEIARGQLGVAQANAETSRGGLVNEQQKLAATVGEKKQGEALAAQDALDSANALVAQIKGVQNHPGLNAGTGTMSGIRSYFNSTDANDFRKSVEGLKSPVFLNELGKLKAAGITLGQVTEAEGKKLEQRIANLDPDQSTPSFKNQVGILLKDTEKFIDKIKAGGKLPTTGGAYLMKVPGIGEVREGDINRILQKNPGSTREQVLQYLQSRAGNAPSGATGGF